MPADACCLPPFFKRTPPTPTGFLNGLGLFLELDSPFFGHVVELIKSPNSLSALNSPAHIIATFDGPGVGKTTFAVEVCRKAGAHCCKLSFATGTLNSVINRVRHAEILGKDTEQIKEVQLLWTQCLVQILASLLARLQSSDEKVNEELALPDCDQKDLERKLLNHFQAIKALGIPVVLLLDDAQHLSQTCSVPNCWPSTTQRCSHPKTTPPSCLAAGFNEFLRCNLMQAMANNIVFWLSGSDVNLTKTLGLQDPVPRFPFCENPDRIFPYFSETNVHTCLDHFLTTELFPSDEFQQTCMQLAGPPKLAELFLQQFWARDVTQEVNFSAMVAECYSKFRAWFAPPPAEASLPLFQLLEKPEVFGGLRCRTIPAIEFGANTQGYQQLTALGEPLGRSGVCRLMITPWEAHLRQLCPFGNWLLHQNALGEVMGTEPPTSWVDPAAPAQCKKAKIGCA